jgi:hypothetical protein
MLSLPDFFAGCGLKGRDVDEALRYLETSNVVRVMRGFGLAPAPQSEKRGPFGVASLPAETDRKMVRSEATSTDGAAMMAVRAFLKSLSYSERDGRVLVHRGDGMWVCVPPSSSRV